MGNVRLLDPIWMPNARRAIVVILGDLSPAIAETALLSEVALAEDCLLPEEDEAWSYLQQATS